MKKIKLSLILPCYNEAEHFEKSAETILHALIKNKTTFEVIFVEDKSQDNTKDLLINFISKHKSQILSAIFHKINQGRGKTVTDGILDAIGEIVGYMDIDCEVSPKYISEFVTKIDDGYDVVYGHRTYETSLSGLIRTIASQTYKKIVCLLLNTTITDTETGYKFFKRKKIIPIVRKTKDVGWFWDTEVMIRSEIDKLKIKAIPVIFKRRKDKTSTVNLFKDSFEYLVKLIQFKNKLNEHN